MENMFGDLVFIDLSTQQIRREPCPRSLLTSYLGGRGLGVYSLLKYLPSSVQPFDPENMLIFATGLFTGTEMIASSRMHLCTRSPLTGFLGSSNVGGEVAHELNLCGAGALIITGKALHPVSIRIHDDRISIEDASEIWGLSTTKTYHKIRERHHDANANVIAIGPAGEHLCAFAAVMADPGHFAGRTGIGAVMGSKLLKAITVRSSIRSRHPKNPDAAASIREYFDLVKQSKDYEKFSTVGSTYGTMLVDADGANSVRNFRDVQYDVIAEAAWAARPDVVTHTKGCYKCPLRCKAEVKIDHGRHKGAIMERPEFEAMLSWGPKCGIQDGTEVVYFNQLCNEYGVDTLEAGNLIAFAMDLVERGIVTDTHLQGLDLYWGNIPAMEALLQQMVYRSTWIGDTLSRGVKYAVRMIGNGAEKYAFAVKGLTMTGMDPRGYKATALGYAVGARGSDYTQVYAKHETAYTPEQALIEYGTEKAADRLSEEGKALMVRRCLSSNALVDSLGLCKIPQLSCLVVNTFETLSRLLRNIVGFDISGHELFTIGERIINAERLCNYKFGATRQDDSLPEKFLREPIPYGVSQGSVVNLDLMLQEYYTLMMWDEHGYPTKEKCAELGLGEFLSLPALPAIGQTQPFIMPDRSRRIAMER